MRRLKVALDDGLEVEVELDRLLYDFGTLDLTVLLIGTLIIAGLSLMGEYVIGFVGGVSIAIAARMTIEGWLSRPRRLPSIFDD